MRCSATNRAHLGALIFASMTSTSASTADAQEQDHIILGVGGSVAPTYQGAKNDRVLPIPAIDIKQGPFFANLRNGVGIAPISNDVVTIGASVNFMQGYRARDVPYGVYALSDGVGARIFATIRAAGFVATIGATKGVLNGTKGAIVDASVSYPIQLSSEFSLTPTFGATWADRRHNDRYFGVSPIQALTSGLPQFDTGSGVKDISGTLTASYRLTDRITLSATGGVTSLVGAMKDSPLVFNKTQPFGFLMLTYRM
jgi:outer membrane protein